MWFAVDAGRRCPTACDRRPVLRPRQAFPVATAWRGAQDARVEVDLPALLTAFRVQARGVLHVGAHLGQERPVYATLGCRRVVWVEANPELAETLRRRAAADPLPGLAEDVIEAAASDVDDQVVTFHVASNGHSSSLLEFGTHRASYPGISVVNRIDVRTRRMDRVLAERPEVASALNLAVVDVQGADLLVLRGLGEALGRFDALVVEVNRRPLYVGCGLVWDIDRHLLRAGFVRRHTTYNPAHWGDAVYVRTRLTAPGRLLRRIAIAGREAAYRVVWGPWVQDTPLRGLLWRLRNALRPRA